MRVFRRLAAFSALIILALLLSACSGAGKEYSAAIELFDNEQFEQAIAAFSALGDYKESQTYILRAKYSLAQQYMNDGDYEQAISIFEELKGFEDSANKLLDCKYRYAKQLAQHGEYVKAKTLFSALGEFSDSKEQIELIDAELNKQSEHEYKEKVLIDIDYFMFYGNWHSKDGYFTFLPKNKCRILESLSLEKPLLEYNAYTWKFDEGYIKVYAEDNLIHDFAVIRFTDNEIEGYDFVEHKQILFKRNDQNSLNAELDFGIQFGMTKTTVKRLDPNSKKVEAKSFLQCSIYVKGEKRSFSGTRTYYFNSKGKLCKITIALDAITTDTVEANYYELSKLLNSCYFDVSVCNLESENVKFANNSFYEEIKSMPDIQLHFWATGSGGMLWTVSDKYSED